MKQKLKDSFLYAFQRSMPIMIGYFALGSANGILMAQKGYSVGLTGIASLFIYAVPPAMLSSVLCFQRCRPTVTAAAMSCGAQAARLVNCVPRRQ